jgi:hypothetical protein
MTNITYPERCQTAEQKLEYAEQLMEMKRLATCEAYGRLGRAWEQVWSGELDDSASEDLLEALRLAMEPLAWSRPMLPEGQMDAFEKHARGAILPG